MFKYSIFIGYFTSMMYSNLILKIVKDDLNKYEEKWTIHLVENQILILSKMCKY